MHGAEAATILLRLLEIMLEIYVTATSVGGFGEIPNEGAILQR